MSKRDGLLKLVALHALDLLRRKSGLPRQSGYEAARESYAKEVDPHG